MLNVTVGEPAKRAARHARSRWSPTSARCPLCRHRQRERAVGRAIVALVAEPSRPLLCCLFAPPSPPPHPVLWVLERLRLCFAASSLCGLRFRDSTMDCYHCSVSKATPPCLCPRGRSTLVFGSRLPFCVPTWSEKHEKLKWPPPRTPAHILWLWAHERMTLIRTPRLSLTTSGIA